MKLPFLALIICFFFSCKNTNKNNESISSKKQINQIDIEKSEYGLIFTNIQVNGKGIKAMIDFGDPHILQLSSGFVKKEKIQVSKTNSVAKDMYGNTFEINEGIANEVIIGSSKESNIKFSSSPNEMESVSEQINTKFEAVVGWGYFSKYYTEINYKSNKFNLYKDKPIGVNTAFSTSYDKKSNYISIPILIKGKKENLIIDTGSSLSMIDSTYYHNNKIDDFNFSIGDKEMLIDVHVQNLPILKQLNSIGIIGGDFLQKYKILIDPFVKKIYFEKQ
ncbi:MAG: hypothetical protein HRT66_06120 [Flavobacteriaceae bacterium]|nr:hypothetical protein [Flavobacteriaceae bacterium]